MDSSIQWTQVPYTGSVPSRLAGRGGTLGYYSVTSPNVASTTGGGKFTVEIGVAGSADSQISEARGSGLEKASAVKVAFEQYFISSPDWDLLLDENGDGAAVIQMLGGAWNDLLFVSIAGGVESKPVRIGGQNFTSPRLSQQENGNIVILARGKRSGLVLIDPNGDDPAIKTIGDSRSALNLDIGSGESAWLFQAFSDFGPISPGGFGAAPVALAIGPTGEVPSPGANIMGNAEIFDMAAAPIDDGMLVLATGPDGVQASTIDIHGNEVEVPLNSLAGSLGSPSVLTRHNADGTADALLAVLLLNEDMSANSLAFATVPLIESGGAAPAA